MKIAIISDIHTDFYIDPKESGVKLQKAIDRFIDEELWLKNADILILAGDNSHYSEQNRVLLETIAQRKIYKKIFVTFGNHDMYLVSNAQRTKYRTSWDKVEELKQICQTIDAVEFLDGNIVEVDGITIGGAGMWYDMSYCKNLYNMDHFEAMHLWKDTMNDANLIYGSDYPKEINDSRARIYSSYGYDRYREYTFDPMKFFLKEKEKLEKIIYNCDIFVSHVGPMVPKTLRVEYQHPTTGFYYFDGKEYLENENAPKLWIFGHSHDSYYFKHNNTTLICNPLGYKHEKINNEVQVVEFDDL